MKRLSAVIIIGLFFSGFCFAQTQTGDASYNASKTGLTISHASMSFNTRVKVTNLRNNMEVIATVNARIPAADPRVADVSKEAGDAIGMSPTGHTQVRLEQLPPQQEVPVVTPPPEADPPPVPPPPQAAAAALAVATPTVTAPAAATSTVTTRAPIEEPIVETIVVSESPAQYLLAPYSPASACPAYPLVMLILLILIVLLLTAILVLLLCMRRIPYGINAPWYYPVWVRRRLRYLKKHRR